MDRTLKYAKQRDLALHKATPPLGRVLDWIILEERRRLLWLGQKTTDIVTSVRRKLALLVVIPRALVQPVQCLGRTCLKGFLVRLALKSALFH